MEAIIGTAIGTGVSSLFGGGGSKAFGGKTEKTSSSSSSAPVNLTPAVYEGLQPDIANRLRALIQPGGIPVQDVPNFRPTRNENAMLQQLQQYVTTGGRTAPVINDTLSGYYLPGQEGGNRYLEDSIGIAQRATKENLEHVLGRTLPGTFTAAGHTISGGLRSPNANLKPGSTAFDLAAARAFGSGASALSDIATNMSSAAYESERGRQAATALQVGRDDVAAMVANIEAQALPRMLKMYGYEQGKENANTQIAQLLQTLQLLAGVAAPVYGNVSSSSSSGSGTTSPNVFASLFPKGLQAG
jgi:hypothetical protein